MLLTTLFPSVTNCTWALRAQAAPTLSVSLFVLYTVMMVIVLLNLRGRGGHTRRPAA